MMLIYKGIIITYLVTNQNLENYTEPDMLDGHPDNFHVDVSRVCYKSILIRSMSMPFDLTASIF